VTACAYEQTVVVLEIDVKLDSIPADMTFGDLYKRLSIWQWMWVFIGNVILNNLVDCEGGGHQARLDSDRNSETMFMAQEAIRQQLKFPTTARFSEHKYGKLNDSEYFYTALVRAENSFGSKVPMYWHVVLAFQPGTASVSKIISVTQTQ